MVKLNLELELEWSCKVYDYTCLLLILVPIGRICSEVSVYGRCPLVI